MILDFTAILGKEDIPREKVHIEQWGGEVLMAGIRADQRVAIQSDYKDSDPSDDMLAFKKKVLKVSLINEDGTPLLKTDEDVDAFFNKSADAIDKIFQHAAILCGFTTDDGEDDAGNE